MILSVTFNAENGKLLEISKKTYSIVRLVICGTLRLEQIMQEWSINVSKLHRNE